VADHESTDASTSEKLEQFRDFMRRRGLKSTRQRDEIASWFFAVHGHLSADAIYREVKEVSPGIGFSTVYRTMRLLREAGLVQERHFGDGEALYENVSDHHDHCICNICGKIVEFENDQIEKLQEAVAQKFGFRLSSHKMELYGTCASCQAKRAAKR
jgi:Fur family ferric uptake transcriptional regulator